MQANALAVKKLHGRPFVAPTRLAAFSAAALLLCGFGVAAQTATSDAEESTPLQLRMESPAATKGAADPAGVPFVPREGSLGAARLELRVADGLRLERPKAGRVPSVAIDYLPMNLGISSLRQRLDEIRREIRDWEQENISLIESLAQREGYLQGLREFLEQKEKLAETATAPPAPEPVAAVTPVAVAPAPSTAPTGILAAIGSGEFDQRLLVEAAMGFVIFGLLAWTLYMFSRSRARPYEEALPAMMTPAPTTPALDQGAVPLRERDHDATVRRSTQDTLERLREKANQAPVATSARTTSKPLSEASVVEAFKDYDRAAAALVQLMRSKPAGEQERLKLLRVLSTVAKKDEFLSRLSGELGQAGDRETRRWVELMLAGKKVLPGHPLFEATAKAKAESAEQPATPADTPSATPSRVPEAREAGAPTDMPAATEAGDAIDYTLFRLRQKAQSKSSAETDKAASETLPVETDPDATQVNVARSEAPEPETPVSARAFPLDFSDTAEIDLGAVAEGLDKPQAPSTAKEASVAPAPSADTTAPAKTPSKTGKDDFAEAGEDDARALFQRHSKHRSKRGKGKGGANGRGSRK